MRNKYYENAQIFIKYFSWKLFNSTLLFYARLGFTIILCLQEKKDNKKTKQIYEHNIWKKTERERERERERECQGEKLTYDFMLQV